VNSIFFKFTGSEETGIVFSTITVWMNDVGLGFITPAFESIGSYVIGLIEWIASILLFMAGTRRLGAILSLATISSIIFIYLVTPINVNRVIDAAGNTDGGILFYMTCSVWISCALILWLNPSR